MNPFNTWKGFTRSNASLRIALLLCMGFGGFLAASVPLSSTPSPEAVERELFRYVASVDTGRPVHEAVDAYRDGDFEPVLQSVTHFSDANRTSGQIVLRARQSWWNRTRDAGSPYAHVDFVSDRIIAVGIIY